MDKRRRWLLGAGTVLAGSGYAYTRGLRYPRLSLEPSALSSRHSFAGATVESNGLIGLPASNIGSTNTEDSSIAYGYFRAIEPEPKLTITVAKGEYKLKVNNVASVAELTVEISGAAEIKESQSGIDRTLKVLASSNTVITLAWKLPVEDGFDFAMIGDTGGGDELDWALTRAKQLDALFLLHLGDFNYGLNNGKQEYETAISAFYSSPIPVYVSIGNHDFHDDGLIYDRFREQIGPMNKAFSLAGTQFINIDTAADFFPAGSGLRGRLFKNLAQDPVQYSDRLFFTHRPLRDPRPHDDHEIGGIGEIAWLKKQITSLSATNMISGHVHHSAELDVDGIRQWTVGEGLGHEDIVLQRPVAKFLMGRAEAGKKLAFNWVDLEMPWRMHTSHTHEIKLRRAQRLQQLAWYKKAGNTI